MSAEKYCYLEERKVQRTCLSYQRQHLTREGVSASPKKELFSMQSDMNALEEKINQVKSTDMITADVF